MQYIIQTISTIIICCSFHLVIGQTTSPNLIGDWTFHSNYTLERNAQNYPGNKIIPPKSRFQRFKELSDPIILYGIAPTERITDFVKEGDLPRSAFSIECWILNHVNMPVGTMMTLRGKKDTEQPAWLMGYYGNEIMLYAGAKDGLTDTLIVPIERGWKRYWGHLVGTYDGQELKLYFNGELVKSSDLLKGELAFPANPQIEMAGYFEEEPYMQISNLVKTSRLYNQALTEEAVEARFEEMKEHVENGKLFRNTFHFNAGPYLHFATQNSINILWETDRRARATVKYGTQLPLDQEVEIKEAAYIQEITLEDLEASTPYYYEILAIAEDGTEMRSGVLTFGTAVRNRDAFSFCIIGDTESRPHINHKLGEMIWEEKPNFMMHLGDVTDGGKEPHKFEWNYEYFSGITPVSSRIPMFPVPGNGESDLYWYNRYHRLPAPEAYYAFRYGNADFFMLNSNANEELKAGGVQYEWLKEQLASSDAKWKFVAHHHCPFSSDENDFGNTWAGKRSMQSDPRFDDLKELYEEAGIDIVFYGHVHAYERSWPITNGQIDKENGVIYIKSGGAGGNLEDFAPTPAYFSRKIQRGNHFCKVDIYDNTLSFKMYDIEGRLKDFLEVEKNE